MKKHENAFILYKFFLLITISFSNVKITILCLSCGRFSSKVIDKQREHVPKAKKTIKAVLT